MSRYIDADMAIIEINKINFSKPSLDKEDVIEQAISAVMHMPTANIEAVRYGHYIRTDSGYLCSVCNAFYDNYFEGEEVKKPYCCMCGSKMNNPYE